KKTIGYELCWISLTDTRKPWNCGIAPGRKSFQHSRRSMPRRPLLMSRNSRTRFDRILNLYLVESFTYVCTEGILGNGGATSIATSDTTTCTSPKKYGRMPCA